MISVYIQVNNNYQILILLDENAKYQVTKIYYFKYWHCDANDRELFMDWIARTFFIKIIVLFISYLMMSCASLPPDIKDIPKPITAPEKTLEKPPPPPKLPKVGLILGPGGLRSFAHLGVIKQLEHKRIPIAAVAGVGWGALIGALYAHKGRSHHIEWQLSKLKEQHISQKGFFQLQKKMGQISLINPYLKSVFSKVSQKNMALPFACTAQFLRTGQQSFLNKGGVQSRLEKCLPIPPIFAPYKGWVASFLGLSKIHKWMESMNIEVIIYVDLLAQADLSKWPLLKDETARVLWDHVKSLHIRDSENFQYKVYIKGPQKGLLDLSKQYIVTGQRAGAVLAQRLTQKYGF